MNPGPILIACTRSAPRNRRFEAFIARLPIDNTPCLVYTDCREVNNEGYSRRIKMDTVTLNESGYDTGMEFEQYCQEAAQHGDNPADYSSDVEDFVFVSVDYAKSDPNWQDAANDPNWPEHLPLWEYRPNG